MKKTKVISERIKQLDNGYKTTIEKEVKERNIYKSYDIAILEFELGKNTKVLRKKEFFQIILMNCGLMMILNFSHSNIYYIF